MLIAAFAYCRTRACERYRNVHVAMAKSINRILFIVRPISETTFLNMTVFADTCLSRVCITTRTQSMNHCLLRAIARVSQKLSRACFLSSRRCFRAVSPEICWKVICVRHSMLSHARYATICIRET